MPLPTREEYLAQFQDKNKVWENSNVFLFEEQILSFSNTKRLPKERLEFLSQALINLRDTSDLTELSPNQAKFIDSILVFSQKNVQEIKRKQNTMGTIFNTSEKLLEFSDILRQMLREIERVESHILHSGALQVNVVQEMATAAKKIAEEKAVNIALGAIGGGLVAGLLCSIFPPAGSIIFPVFAGVTLGSIAAAAYEFDLGKMIYNKLYASWAIFEEHHPRQAWLLDKFFKIAILSAALYIGKTLCSVNEALNMFINQCKQIGISVSEVGITQIRAMIAYFETAEAKKIISNCSDHFSNIFEQLVNAGKNVITSKEAIATLKAAALLYTANDLFAKHAPTKSTMSKSLVALGGTSISSCLFTLFPNKVVGRVGAVAAAATTVAIMSKL